MPGIQHDPHAGIVDAGEQVFRFLRLREGEARPPLVLHEEIKGGLHPVEQVVDELNRTVQNLIVRVQPTISITFLQRNIRDVKYHIRRVQGLLPECQILLELPQQILRAPTAINLLNHFP